MNETYWNTFEECEQLCSKPCVKLFPLKLLNILVNCTIFDVLINRRNTDYSGGRTKFRAL
jgi:hypothetical protein